MTDWIFQTLESTPPVLAIDFETAVFLVVVVVSLLGRLFGRKEDPEHGQEWFDEEDDEYAKQRQESAAMDWEEQMRRLLEGESPAEPTPTAQPQPQPQTQSLAPPAIPQPTAPPPLPVAQPVSSARSSAPEPRVVTAADLAASKAELEAAKAKAAEAQANLGAKKQRRRKRRPQARNAIRLLRSPETAQQAIIAATILGKPKGLN